MTGRLVHQPDKTPPRTEAGTGRHTASSNTLTTPWVSMTLLPPPHHCTRFKQTNRQYTNLLSKHITVS